MSRTTLAFLQMLAIGMILSHAGTFQARADGLRPSGGSLNLQPQVLKGNGPKPQTALPAPTPTAPPIGPGSATPPGGQLPKPNASNPLLNLLSPNGGPGPNTDWSRYEYPDNYKFHYGGRGAGNIGNGLCTAANRNRTQVQNGHCQMLKDILGNPASCANREMNRIIDMAGPSGAGVTDLPRYCANWSSYPRDKKLFFFQQLLAGLITQESGWNAGAIEPSWSKNGIEMQGKGLFQIAVRDRFQDIDCAGLDDSSILQPEPNMKCGACIALKYLAMDRAMGHGTGDLGARGMARYFGPMRDGQSHKRDAIANATNYWCASGGGADAGSSSSTR